MPEKINCAKEMQVIFAFLALTGKEEE